jgi:hypothetical protein
VILREIEGVLLDLGTGFAFVARQKRMSVGKDDFHLELLQLDAKSIRVSEYLTALPPLPMLRERLHQAMDHARGQAARRLPDAEGRS